MNDTTNDTKRAAPADRGDALRALDEHFRGVPLATRVVRELRQWQSWNDDHPEDAAVTTEHLLRDVDAYLAAHQGETPASEARKCASDHAIAWAEQWVRDHGLSIPANVEDTLLEALAAYDPAQVGARSVAAPKPAAETGSTGADAARYRWLREHLAGEVQINEDGEISSVFPALADWMPGELDAAIDAAMAASPTQDAAHGGRHDD